MDAQDSLARFRERFFIPQQESGEDCIYLCGHSLGLQPKTATSFVQQELRDWARLGVEGHFHARNPWMPYHRLLTQQTADVVGAGADEVVVMNSLTVNLHLMMVSFYRPTAQRNQILVESGAFPSDQYAVQSQIRFHGFDPKSSILELVPRKGESYLRNSDVIEFIEEHGESIALILLGAVNYGTGQFFDLPEIARTGKSKGCIVGFDLAHAVGNVPLHLHDWDPDFSVWCSYKYLNGGPGCVGGCFVHQRHSVAGMPRFNGWWGHDEKSRFQMGPHFNPMPGAEGWQLSNPPIFALAPLRASMEIFSEVGIAQLRAKSVSLTSYLEFLLLQSKLSDKFSIITPSDSAHRGAQLSIRLPAGGRRVCDSLAAKGVIGDWREPDIFRVAPVPLYNSYTDVYRFVETLVEILAQ